MQLFSADEVFCLFFWSGKSQKNHPQKLLMIGPKLFLMYWPGCPNQPRIDFSCHKYVSRRVCSLICDVNANINLDWDEDSATNEFKHHIILRGSFCQPRTLPSPLSGIATPGAVSSWKRISNSVLLLRNDLKIINWSHPFFWPEFNSCGQWKKSMLIHKNI